MGLSLRICTACALNAAFSHRCLFFRRRQAAVRHSQIENKSFHLSLHSPFTIFAPYCEIKNQQMSTIQPLPYRQQVVSLLKLGLPIVVGQLGMIVLGLADTIMIGHHSTVELAAAAFVNNVFNLVIIFATGFSYGLTPLIGMLQGSGNTQGIGRVFRNALIAHTGVAVLLTAAMYVVYCFVDKMGLPEELLPHIRPYFILQLISLVFVMLFNSFRQFAEGLTDTRTPMWILLGGNALNIVGNYLLIYGSFGLPEWGLFGAGLSTLVSRVVMLLVFVAIVGWCSRYRIYREAIVHSRFNRNDFVQLNALGWPLGLQMGMETAAFSLSAIMVGWLGSVPLAAHQIMISVSTLGFMVYYGMGAALAVRVSHFMGQRDFSNLRRAVNVGLGIILALAVVASLFFYLARVPIVNSFTDDPEVMAVVAMLIYSLIVYQFGDALQITFANALRGTAEVKPMMWIAFLAYFLIALPVGYLCGFTLDGGVVGVWVAFPAGLFSAGFLFWMRFRYRLRKLMEIE